MLGLIGPLLSLATEGLRYMNLKEGKKYLDEMVALQKAILAAESEGYNSDDQEIVVLYGRLAIVAQAAVNEAKLNAPHA